MPRLLQDAQEQEFCPDIPSGVLPLKAGSKHCSLHQHPLPDLLCSGPKSTHKSSPFCANAEGLASL